MAISLQMLFDVYNDPTMVIPSESSFMSTVHVYMTSPSAAGVKTSLDQLRGYLPNMMAVPIGEVDI